MKIAIDLTAFSPRYDGGVGTYSKSLVIAVCELIDKHSISILCTSESLDWLLENLPSKIEIQLISPRHHYLTRLFYGISYHLLVHPLFLKYGQRLRWKECIKFLKKSSITVIYTPTTYLNFTSKKFINIVSLHDCQEMRYPDFFTKRQLRYRKVNVINTLKNAHSVQVSSNFVGEEIKFFFPNVSKSTNFIVIKEGVDTKYYANPIKRRDYRLPILLMPASFHLHKNHKLVYESMSKLATDTPFEIWFTGLENEISINLKKNYTNPSNVTIRYLGFLSKSELRQSYQLATVVLSTSLYESSSLPLLEGISTGCVPIASNIPAHVEMSKLLNIKLYESNSSSSLAECIDEVIFLHNSCDLPGIVEGNNIKIKDFDWGKIAMNYWDNLLKLKH